MIHAVVLALIGWFGLNGLVLLLAWLSRDVEDQLDVHELLDQARDRASLDIDSRPAVESERTS